MLERSPVNQHELAENSLRICVSQAYKIYLKYVMQRSDLHKQGWHRVTNTLNQRKAKVPFCHLDPK